MRINKALVAGNKALELLPVYRKENTALKTVVAEQKSTINDLNEVIKNHKTVNEVVEIQYKTVEVRNTQLERELPQLKLQIVKQETQKKSWRKASFIGIPVALGTGAILSLIIFK